MGNSTVATSYRGPVCSINLIEISLQTVRSDCKDWLDAMPDAAPVCGGKPAAARNYGKLVRKLP